MRKWRLCQVALIFSLLLNLIIVTPPTKTYAASPDVLKTGKLEFPVDTHTAKGGDGITHFSSNSSLTPNSIDFASLGIDTSRVISATLISTLGTATCSTTECTFTSVNGTAGYFDWWRNQAGVQSVRKVQVSADGGYVTFDSLDGPFDSGGTPKSVQIL
jgi:hypothetical protein